MGAKDACESNSGDAGMKVLALLQSALRIVVLVEIRGGVLARTTVLSMEMSNPEALSVLRIMTGSGSPGNLLLHALVRARAHDDCGCVGCT